MDEIARTKDERVLSLGDVRGKRLQHPIIKGRLLKTFRNAKKMILKVVEIGFGLDEKGVCRSSR